MGAAALCGLNLWLVPRTGTPGPSDQLAEVEDRRKRGSDGARKPSANKKKWSQYVPNIPWDILLLNVFV